MAERWEELRVGGGLMHAFTSAPDGAGPFPAVVVIQHVGGVDSFIQRITRRVAAGGYFGIAPGLYHRQDPSPDEENMARMGRLRDDEVIEDVNAAVEFLQGHGAVDGERIGVTGFCMGGRVVFMMAAVNPVFKAAVPFYAAATMQPWGDGPAPFDRLASIQCPVLGFFGEDDRNPSPEDMRKLDEELTRHGKEHEFHSYPNAGHAFMNSTNEASYREQAAKVAWPMTLRFFDRHLRSAAP